MFGLIAPKSRILLLIGVRGPLLKMDYNSHKYVGKVLSINILSVVIARNIHFTSFINNSHEAPIISVKWSVPGHFLKAQGKFISHFHVPFFLHISDT